MLYFLKCIFNKSIAVVLMVIVVVQSNNRLGTDDEIVQSCANMLSTFFNVEENNGGLNFIQAFQRITRKKIQKQFKEKEDEESWEATERLTSLQLNMLYFESLLNTNGIRYARCKTPQEWCRNEANDLIGELPEFANKTKYYQGQPWRDADQLYNSCTTYIQSISHHFISIKKLNPDTIMQILYLEFSEDLMNYVDMMGKESRTHQPDEIEYNTYFLNKFAKPFYDCYVRLLMKNLGNLTGPYSSVPEFCMSKGIQIIKDFKGLGYAPFMQF